MLMGRKMRVDKHTIDISEIPFKIYHDKNIPLTIIRDKEIQGKKSKVCIPFMRSVYSLETHNRLALSHYTSLQKNEKIQKLIETKQIPKIQCENDHEDTHMWIVYDDEGSNPTLICSYCMMEWGKLPEEVLEVYNLQWPRHLINVPDVNEEIWLIFDDDHIDRDRTGKVIVTKKQDVKNEFVRREEAE